MFVLVAVSARAYEKKSSCPRDEITHYSAYHVSQPIPEKGKLDEKVWQKAPESPRFVDIITGKPALFDTRAVVFWNDANLHISFRLQELLFQARFTTNDSPINFEIDAEVFIAGKDAYHEFEIKGCNTTYKAFFIWDDYYVNNGFSRVPEFRRSLLPPFNGVGFTHHPRGGRLGDFYWHFPGKQTVVFMDGTYPRMFPLHPLFDQRY